MDLHENKENATKILTKLRKSHMLIDFHATLI